MMNNSKNTTSLTYTTYWFVHDSYTPAGRPKGETAVMQYAEGKYLHCIIQDDCLEAVLKDITNKAAQILEENKRLAPVDVRFSRSCYLDDTTWLYIGAQHLTLQKVKSIFFNIIK